MLSTKEMILAKLENYPEDVREVAKYALKIAETTTASGVADQLGSCVREVVRKMGPEK